MFLYIVFRESTQDEVVSELPAPIQIDDLRNGVNSHFKKAFTEIFFISSELNKLLRFCGKVLSRLGHKLSVEYQRIGSVFKSNGYNLFG